MTWFFLALAFLVILLRFFGRFLVPEGDSATGEYIFSKRCVFCDRKTRYEITSYYAFVDCEHCGQKNFAVNPRINPRLLESLSELDAVLPKDHRLFDFFTHTYLVSCLAIAKSDGVISGVERDFILKKLRSFLGGGYNEALTKSIYQKTVAHFAEFSDLILIEFTLVYEVWHALLFIRQKLPEHEGNELVEFLLSSVFETAYADQVLDPREERLLREFAQRLGFSPGEFAARLAAARAYSSARSDHEQFSQAGKAGEIPASVYEFFAVTPRSTKEEIKKAYRTLAQRYHPDKYHHLPAEMQKSAEEKFKEIANQYALLLKRAPR